MMIRRPAAVLAAAAAAVALAVPAAAAVARNESGKLQESFSSHNWRAGGGSLALGASVTEASSGRDMAFTATGGTYDGFTVGNLATTEQSDRCADMDPANPSYVEWSHCSGQSGVSWAEDNSGAHQKYINVYRSKKLGGQYDLSGPDCSSAGCDFRIQAKGAAGWLQSFDFVSG